MSDWRCPVCGFGQEETLSHSPCVQQTAQALVIMGAGPTGRAHVRRLSRGMMPWLKKLIPAMDILLEERQRRVETPVHPPDPEGPDPGPGPAVASPGDR